MPIIRIVKMTFTAETIEQFKTLFASVEDKIRQFEGCQSMVAYTEVDNPFTVFTYSEWNSLENLENYRKSPLFKDTWAKTKVLFGAPAQAWSLEKFCSNS